MSYLVDVANAVVLLANYIFVPAIAYGAQLALGALGVTLVFGTLRFANFAHGDLMAFGTGITILITLWFQSIGISFGIFPTALLALPIAIALTAGITLLTDKAVYRYYRKQKSKSITFVMASIGVMFIMNGLVRLMVGPGERNFYDGERFIIRANEFRDMTGLKEGLAIKMSQSITLVIALLLVAAIFWFLYRTRTGKSLRAFSDNEDLALLSGINPERIVFITWLIAASLATIAGVLYGLDKGFRPFTYFHLLLPIFAAAVVGGIGHPIGAIVGGFLVSFSEIAITYVYRKFFAYLLPEEWLPDGLMQLLSTDYKLAVAFVILVIVLLVRPTGIFKGRLL